MAISTSVIAKVQVNETGTAALGTPSLVHVFDASVDIGSGTTSGNADLVWSATRSVTNGANDDLDLNNSLIQTFGTSLQAVKVVGLYIKNSSTTDRLLVGGAASNPVFTGLFGASAHTISVPPGGSLLWTAPASPATIVAATGDILRVSNFTGTAPVTYTILVIGRSV
jgi:hypothetical protein